MNSSLVMFGQKRVSGKKYKTIVFQMFDKCLRFDPSLNNLFNLKDKRIIFDFKTTFTRNTTKVELKISHLCDNHRIFSEMTDHLHDILQFKNCLTNLSNQIKCERCP